MSDNNLSFRLATPDNVEAVYEVYCDVCGWLHNVRGITDQWEGEPAKEEIRELNAKRYKRFNVMLKTEAMDRLEQEAKKQGISKAKLVNNYIMQ